MPTLHSTHLPTATKREKKTTKGIHLPASPRSTIRHDLVLSWWDGPGLHGNEPGRRHSSLRRGVRHPTCCANWNRARGHVRSAEVPWLCSPAKKGRDEVTGLGLDSARIQAQKTKKKEETKRYPHHTSRTTECPVAEWSLCKGRHTHTQRTRRTGSRRFGLAMEADQTGFSSSSPSGVAGVAAAAGANTCSEETEDSTPPTPNNRWAHYWEATDFFYLLIILLNLHCCASRSTCLTTTMCMCLFTYICGIQYPSPHGMELNLQERVTEAGYLYRHNTILILDFIFSCEEAPVSTSIFL